MPDQLSHPRSPLPWERGSGSSHSSIVPDEEPRVTGAVQPPVVNPVPKQSGIVVTPAEHQNARPAHRQTARSFSTRSGSSHSSIVPDEEPRVTGAVQPPVVNPVPKQSGIVVTPAEHQNARPAHRQTARSFSNDPSAGSPTKTLLRLLLPTNKKVQ